MLDDRGIVSALAGIVPFAALDGANLAAATADRAPDAPPRTAPWHRHAHAPGVRRGTVRVRHDAARQCRGGRRHPCTDGARMPAARRTAGDTPDVAAPVRDATAPLRSALRADAPTRREALARARRGSASTALRRGGRGAFPHRGHRSGEGGARQAGRTPGVRSGTTRALRSATPPARSCRRPQSATSRRGPAATPVPFRPRHAYCSSGCSIRAGDRWQLRPRWYRRARRSSVAPRPRAAAPRRRDHPPRGEARRSSGLGGAGGRTGSRSVMPSQPALPSTLCPERSRPRFTCRDALARERRASAEWPSSPVARSTRPPQARELAVRAFEEIASVDDAGGAGAIDRAVEGGRDAPRTLAALVNEALVEQARLRGVDLS